MVVERDKYIIDYIIKKGSDIMAYSIEDVYKLCSEINLEKADIILITHEHFDHYSPEDVEKIKKENTIIVTTPVTAEKINGNVKTVIPGDELEISGIKIKAVPFDSLPLIFPSISHS